jgi:hypothetical protein
MRARSAERRGKLRVVVAAVPNLNPADTGMSWMTAIFNMIYAGVSAVVVNDARILGKIRC